MKLTKLLPLLGILISSSHAETLYSHSCKGSPGEIAACHLEIAYHNATTWCGRSESENRAGSLCSGVLLRGTSIQRGKYRAWDIRPEYKGVSFSYLRRDANFGKMAFDYQTGFILFPYDHTPSGLQMLTPKCAFPFDGDTVNRKDYCGQNRNFIQSNPCYTLNPPVNSSEKWINHFEKNNVSTTSGQTACSFMLDESDGHDQFLTFISSRNQLISKLGETKTFNAENEIVMPRWNISDVSGIPIEAFFYLNGSEKGLTVAKKDQLAFYEDSNHKRIVPIIRLTLPKHNKDVASFSYLSNEQAVK